MIDRLHLINNIIYKLVRFEFLEGIYLYSLSITWLSVSIVSKAREYGNKQGVIGYFFKSEKELHGDFFNKF